MFDKTRSYTRYPPLPRRLGAYLLDYALLITMLVLPQAALTTVTGGFPFNRLRNGWQIAGWVLVSISLPAWLYFSWSESSVHQATIGKRLLGLQVVSVEGGQVAFRNALLRTTVKLLPWELTHLTLLLPVPLWWDATPGFRPGLAVACLLMGVYLMVLWRNPQRRGLHELAAGTVVVRAKGEEQ